MILASTPLLPNRYAIRQARDTTAVPTPRAAGGFFDRVRQRSGGITPRPNTAAGAPANGGEYRAAGPSTGSVGGIPPPAGTPTLLTQCLGCDPSDNLDPISRRGGISLLSLLTASILLLQPPPANWPVSPDHTTDYPVSHLRREIITFFRRMRNFLRIAPPREHWLVWCSLNFYICTVVTFWMLEPYQTVNDRVQARRRFFHLTPLSGLLLYACFRFFSAGATGRLLLDAGAQSPARAISRSEITHYASHLRSSDSTACGWSVCLQSMVLYSWGARTDQRIWCAEKISSLAVFGLLF